MTTKIVWQNKYHQIERQYLSRNRRESVHTHKQSQMMRNQKGILTATNTVSDLDTESEEDTEGNQSEEGIREALRKAFHAIAQTEGSFEERTKLQAKW